MNPILKSLNTPVRSLARAIAGHCYECMGGSRDDTDTRQTVTGAVRECDCQSCAFWLHRPYRSSQRRQAERSQALARPDERVVSSWRPGAPPLPQSAFAASKTSALKAKCADCVGGADVPRFRHLVRDCEMTHCTVHAVRPWQNLIDRSEAPAQESPPLSPIAFKSPPCSV